MLKYQQMNSWTVPANISLFGVGGKGKNAQLRNSTTASTEFLPLRVSSEGCVAHIGQSEREAVKRQNLFLFLSRMKRYEVRGPICLLSYLIPLHMRFSRYQYRELMAIPRHPSRAQSWVSATSGQCLGCPCCTAKRGAELPGSLNLTRTAGVQG